MNRSRLLTSLGFALAIALTVPACVFHASGRVRTTGTVVVRQPPEPRAESYGTKSGYVWVRGYWQWNGNDYVWMDGHWERERSGRHWKDGYWDHRGNGYVWVEGEWTVVSSEGGGTAVVHDVDHTRPTERDHRDHDGGGTTVVVVDDGRPHQPPPSPQSENPGTKKGYVWIVGHWDWKAGEWAWLPGHWERAKSKHRWRDGEWRLDGDVYIYVEGGWEKDESSETRPRTRDHR